MNLLLKNGRIIDPSQNINDHMDILIEGKKITRLEKNIHCLEKENDSSITIIDLAGFVVTPGLIDMHTHLREPGFEYKETIRTGSKAAVAGGFTSIACMANTDPVNDTRAVTEFITQQAKAADMAHVFPVAALSKGLKGQVLTEFSELKEAGAIAVSDDGKPVISSALMRNALEYASSFDLPVISHCEETSLSADGLMNEGYTATYLGLPGIPTICEDIMVQRDIAIAEFTSTAVHIAHVSTAGSVRTIRQAQSRGVAVTAETAPHYFALSDESLNGFSTLYKMHPPLRSRYDMLEIKEGLRDGTISVIASDHAPHSSVDKDVEFKFAANGIIGLETSLGLSLKLVEDKILTLDQLIAKMSTYPASILKIPKGTLRPGSDADITVIDLNKEWTVDVNSFRSKSRNSPFAGWHMKGKAVLTIVNGIIKYKDL